MVFKAGKTSVLDRPVLEEVYEKGQGTSTDCCKLQTVTITGFSHTYEKWANFWVGLELLSFQDRLYRILKYRQIWDMAGADMTETFQGRTIAGRGDAESIAIQVLNFIVADVDRIIQFLNVTGLQPETIRESATSSHFLLGVLEYVAKDDELLKAIDQEMKIRPTAILAAIVHLSPESDEKTREEKVAATPQLPRRNLFH